MNHIYFFISLKLNKNFTDNILKLNKNFTILENFEVTTK